MSGARHLISQIQRGGHYGPNFIAQPLTVAVAGAAFYLDQKLMVQLPLSEEAPEGGVVALELGWYDSENLDPRVATNPIVMRLIRMTAALLPVWRARAAMNRKISNGEAQPGRMCRRCCKSRRHR